MKPKPINNPEYTKIFLAILKGKDKHSEIRKSLIPNATSQYIERYGKELKRSKPYKSSSNFSMKLQQLRELGFIKTTGKNKFAKNYVDYESIINYINKTFFRNITNIKAYPTNIQLLKEYLLELSNIPEYDKGLGWILEKFVIGLGKEYSKNTLFMNTIWAQTKKKKMLNRDARREDFLQNCWIYSLSVGKDGYEVIAGEIINPDKKAKRERMFGC